MREHQPLGGFMHVVIGNQVGLVPARLVPRHGNAGIVRRVVARPLPELLDDRGDRVSRIEHVIDDQ